MNLVSLYAGHTRLRAFFRGEKSTFEIYGRFKRIYADSSEYFYPLDRFFPIAMNYGFVTNRCYRSVSFTFERTKFCWVSRFLSVASRVIFTVPINGLAFPRIFFSLKEIPVIAWILICPGFGSSLINNSTILINLQYFFFC